MNDIVNKYLLDCPEPDNAEQISSALDNSSVSEDVPIKQRLRPRNEKNTPAGERKKKINIISNEIYTGVLPEAANISSISVCVTQKPKVQQVTASHSSLKVVEKSLTLQAFPLSSPPPIVKTSEKARLDLESENKDVLKAEASKKESTPKTRINQSFLDSKSKSTPRRKATHVRILDFNHTPSNRKLFIIKELSTPRTNGIPAFTPGSAPASFSVNCTMKCSQKNQQEGAAETVDDNSNSNSISHTPKVVKGRRRRKIAVSKSIEKNQTQEELKQPNMSLEDWFTMRKQSKDIPIDQLARKANEKAETEGKTQGQKRKTQKRKSAKRKVLGGNQKRMSKISKEQKENEEKKDEENSTSIEYDENKPLIKFKIKSPRKNAATKKKTGKSKTVIATVKLKPDHGNSSKMIKIHPEDCPSSLNRSDTVQEVATMLTTLSETILAKDNNIKKMELLQTPFKDLNVDAETPFKDNSLTPLPNTPRFAIPLMSQSNQTPMPKTFDSCTSAMSLVKLNDILTPSFPITPGLKETPLKEIEGSPTSAGNYSSRRTDYSSCSSYYKPDESEDITSFLNPRTRSNHMSQSESDAEKPLQIVGSTKKVECPGAIERVKSFENKLPTPHYTMMDEGLLSESLVGTATEDSSDSSSSFTCSTCSTDPSDEENTIEKLNKVTTDIDSEWNCDDDEKDEITSTAVVNEKTGEVRFPLRNWITPKKVDVESQSQKLIEINALENAAKLKEHRERMKEIRVRTLEKIRLESAIVKPKNAVPLQQKYRRSNAKAFKLPSEETRRQPAHSRKDQILQQNLTERPRPTPLKLIHASSSSRRKNATPRKTIIIDELPRQISPPKKKREKKAEISYMKSSVTALESVNDNAVTLEPNLNDSLNISSSFTASIENDSAHAVFARNKSVLDGGSIHKLDKYETITIQSKLADKHLSELDSSSGDDNEEDALEIVTAEKMRKNEFYFVEPDDFQRSKVLSNECVIPPMIIHFEGKNITLNCSGVIDIFSLDPVVIDKCDQKKNESPKSNKEKLLNDDGLKNFRQGATMR